jgi:hypothetical protein
MKCKFVAAVVLAACGLLVIGSAGHAQQVLKSTGWGSLSGKVTLDKNAAIPEPVSLVPKMMMHVDKACCLDPNAKDAEKMDSTWIVDPKTRGVANVVVWLKLPKGTYFPIPDRLKVRKEEIIVDQPHCAFIPHVSAYNPVYFDGDKEVATGQKLIIKNSAVVPHNIRATGSAKYGNEGFNKTLPAKTEFSTKFNPQPTPINLNCDLHTWMTGKLFVFDHPYYAITKADGTFEIPVVPAGAEVILMGWHEEKGYVNIKGVTMTFKEGKNTYDFEVSK